MRRTSLWTVLVLSLVAVPPRTATAQWWAWMEEYSGPGPFKDDGYYFTLSPLCWGGQGDTGGESERRAERIIGRSSADAARCIYADWVSLKAGPDPVQGYPRIDAHMVDVGISVRLHPAIDIGLGAGVIRFLTSATPTDLATTRFVFVPARVTLKPLLLVHEYRSRRLRALMSAWKIQFKQSYVRGDLTGADFGAPTNPFRVDGEAIGSLTNVIDVLEALRAW